MIMKFFAFIGLTKILKIIYSFTKYYAFYNTHMPSQINTITGFVISIRRHSKKLAFIDIRDESDNETQLVFDHSQLQESDDFFTLHLGLREGDLISATGIFDIKERLIVHNIKFITSHRHTLSPRSYFKKYPIGSHSEHEERLYFMTQHL